MKCLFVEAKELTKICQYELGTLKKVFRITRGVGGGKLDPLLPPLEKPGSVVLFANIIFPKVYMIKISHEINYH